MSHLLFGNLTADQCRPVCFDCGQELRPACFSDDVFTILEDHQLDCVASDKKIPIEGTLVGASETNPFSFWYHSGRITLQFRTPKSLIVLAELPVEGLDHARQRHERFVSYHEALGCDLRASLLPVRPSIQRPYELALGPSKRALVDRIAGALGYGIGQPKHVARVILLGEVGILPGSYEDAEMALNKVVRNLTNEMSDDGESFF